MGLVVKFGFHVAMSPYLIMNALRMGAVNTESVMGIAYSITLPVMVQLVLISVMGTDVSTIKIPATANAKMGGNSVEITTA